MLLNKEKTNILRVSKKRMPDLPQPILGCRFQRKIKYLGFIIDESLTFQQEVEELIKKCNKAIARAWTLHCDSTPLKAKVEIWKIFARTHLIYAAPALIFAP